MEILHFPLSTPSLLEDEDRRSQPVHDIRELFELAFPLTTEHALQAEEAHLDNVLPFKP